MQHEVIQQEIYGGFPFFDRSREHGLKVPVDFRYEYFFDFLRLSQSYWLAHQYKNGLIEPKKVKFPKDFDQVLKTYEAFGDVTKSDFPKWWIENAQYQFGIKSDPRGSLLLKLGVKEPGSNDKIEEATVKLKQYLDEERPTQGNRAMVVIALPIYSNRVVMKYEFDRLLNESQLPLVEPREIYPYHLLNNKVRTDMMDAAYRTTLYRAEHKDKKLFDIGMEMDISAPLNIEEYNYEDRKRGVESMTSRLLRKAHRLAENAARGVFPSIEQNPNSKTTFDWDILQDQYSAYLSG